MKAIVTGAGGFVGRHLVERLLAQGYRSVTVVDRSFPDGFCSDEPRVLRLAGAIEDQAVRTEALARSFDVLFHLAAVPGGAAEADPPLSRRVNLDATLDLFEEAAAAARRPRIVYTSSIAVLGNQLPDPVLDSAPLDPAMAYGAHKAMAELALADMHRRELVDAVGVRLPGIVARPPAPSGLKSAFLSNLFHAFRQGEAFTSPVSSAATFWLMSVGQCTANLAHGAKLDASLLPRNRTVTLPAIHCTMAALVAAVAHATDRSPQLVRYEPDAALERDFGVQPALVAAAAERAGFAADNSLAALVERVLQEL
ncbi:MAG: NAD-dependent epimerase/dehydratase family protein [Spongiibacteraceae bacterium]|jgi:nucleoside-diphosphate-sugar epimerase|nr:NAD-dependent epimerase/dehydratase family protein [Spongiibacteraceae bacterium]